MLSDAAAAAAGVIRASCARISRRSSVLGGMNTSKLSAEEKPDKPARRKRKILPRLRPRPREVVTTPILSLDNLPAQPEARLAALDLIFRQAIARRLGTAEESLRREQLSALGEHAAAAEQVYRALEAARYRGDSPDGLEASVRRIVEQIR
jgi:hypothetical protein